MDQEIKIGYSKKQIRVSLILGILFFGLFLSTILIDSDNYLSVSNGLLAALHLLSYAYLSRKPFLTITPDYFQTNGFPPKKIKRTEIVEIKHFAGEYTIRSAKQKIVIDVQFLEPESASKLRSTLDRLIASRN